MLAARTLWHAGRSTAITADGEATGFDALDVLLPQRGWPRRALTELLLPADGVGELALLLPTLARLTQAGAAVAVIAPPYVPYAPAWQAAGVDLAQLQVVEAAPRDALWAFEQCLRSGACGAVLGWPVTGDAQALRRLQVAADSGDCLGFALRDRRHAANPSPAALRLEAVRAEAGMAWRVRKCRGGPVPAQGFVIPAEVVPQLPVAEGQTRLRTVAQDERDLPAVRCTAPDPAGNAAGNASAPLRSVPDPVLPRRRGQEAAHLQQDGLHLVHGQLRG
jgi:cell division inhibitor SulA